MLLHLNKLFPRRRPSRGTRPRHRAKTLDVLRAHPRVLEIDREPSDGWFITLRAGWKSPHDPLCPVHCFGATTLTAALKDVNAALPCGCGQCASELRS